MPDAHDPARHVPADAVTNVLAGKTADGSAPFDLRIPFSKNPDSRTAAGTLLRSVIENLNGTLPPEHLTPLTAKLLSHLSKTGLQSPEAIAAFPASTLADAIREAPHLIGTKASIAAVLRGHQRRNEQAASALQQTLPSDVPERLVLWQRGDYRLEEATDPRHLQKDSADLKHCVGTAFNSAALQEKGLSPHDSEAINYLHYWMKMKTGETRILTLTRLGRPLVTLEHDTELRAILQICGYRNQTPEFGDAFLKPLCGALSAIREPFGLTKIHNLPVPPPNTILHASGAFLPVTEDYIADALAGSVQLPPHPSASLLKAAAASPLITLDITAATQSALDTLEEAACHLISSSKSVCLPALQSSGDIHLTAARRVKMPALHSSRDIRLLAATTVEMPALQSSGDIDLLAAPTVEMPALHSSRDIRLPAATTVEMPALQSSRDIYLPAATTVEMPALQSSRGIYLPAATTVKMPALDSSEGLGRD